MITSMHGGGGTRYTQENYTTTVWSTFSCITILFFITLKKNSEWKCNKNMYSLVELRGSGKREKLYVFWIVPSFPRSPCESQNEMSEHTQAISN